MTRKIPPHHEDSTVRLHRADGTLIVTRDDEANEHVIKSRGRESRDQWTRRVPETRTVVEPGEHLWCIPGNWTRYYRLKVRSGPDKAIYHIPESGDSILLSLAHEHDHLVDAYHIVEDIGSITWTAHADVDQDALLNAINRVTIDADKYDDGVREVLQYVRDNPRDAVRHAEETAVSRAPGCVENWEGIPASEFDPFQVPFRTDVGVVSHPKYSPESEVMERVRYILRSFKVVPPSPLVSVTVQ